MSDPVTHPRTTTRSPRNVTKIVAATLGLLLVVAVVAGAVAWYLYMRPSSADVEPGRPVQVEIPAGAGTQDIARVLADAGVIGNAATFRLAARIAEVDGSLKAGVYQLATGMPDELVIDKLVAGPAPVETVTVTIPEGWRITQIAERFAKEAGIPEDEFLQLASAGAKEFSANHPYLEDAHNGSLEGFLFPKTYTFEKDATASEVIEMMLEQFDEEITEVDVAAAEQRGLSLPELVTIASIIERETKLAEELPLVSSVIRNRLDIDMRLQMCSTVVYVLDRNDLRLTTAETKTESPYNTYLHTGLPPGPIASPGLAALKAAAAPADTEYIYDVLTGKDGSHTFASSNADFLRAKQKSKEVFGQ
jgi:UPF0755 protein